MAIGQKFGKTRKKSDHIREYNEAATAPSRGHLCEVFQKDRIVFKVPFSPRPMWLGAERRQNDTCDKKIILPTLNTSKMKNAMKRLPILMAVICAVVVSACSEIDVNPRGEGDDETPPIIIKPKPRSTNAPDSVVIG